MSIDEEKALFEQTQPEATEIWQKVMSVLQSQLTRPAYETWFRPVVALGIEDNALHLFVPSDFSRDWIESRYLVILQELLIKLGHPLSIKLVMPSAVNKTTDFTAALTTALTTRLAEEFEQKLQQTRQELLNKIAESEQKLRTELQQATDRLLRLFDQASASTQNNDETSIHNG